MMITQYSLSLTMSRKEHNPVHCKQRIPNWLIIKASSHEWASKRLSQEVAKRNLSTLERRFCESYSRHYEIEVLIQEINNIFSHLAYLYINSHDIRIEACLEFDWLNEEIVLSHSFKLFLRLYSRIHYYLLSIVSRYLSWRLIQLGFNVDYISSYSFSAKSFDSCCFVIV